VTGGGVSRTVLIADGDAERGERLAAACRELGLACKTAPHGAAALELALAERPALVVAPLDLPLVDGLKLAEILRANPRTRAARFLFLGREEDLGRRGSVGDLLLPSVDGPESVLPAVRELLARHDRLDLLDAEAESGGEARGDLAQISLAELLQLFHVSRRSGRLAIEGDAGDREAAVWMRDGEVMDAQVGEIEGAKALFRLLTRREGRFVFEAEPPDGVPRILTPTRGLLTEGLRQLAEWERLAGQLPPLDAQAKLRVKSSELPNIVHPLTQEVLLLLELYSRVGELVDHCSFPDYQVLRTLHTLAQRGIVEITRSSPRRIGPAAETQGLFGPGCARGARAAGPPGASCWSRPQTRRSRPTS
jgi:CheY-like chemotaxis protein